MILALLINTQILIKNTKLTAEWPKVFISGICLGVAIGFKLTMIIYGIGTALAFLSLEKNLKINIQQMILFIFGMTIGFLAINGYWMILLWMNFKNPFFPFFNGIFKSPFFYNNIDISVYLGPRKFFETIFYPFIFHGIE